MLYFMQMHVAEGTLAEGRKGFLFHNKLALGTFAIDVQVVRYSRHN